MSGQQTYYLLQFAVPTGTGSTAVVQALATVNSPAYVLEGGAYSVNVSGGDFAAHVSISDMYMALPSGSWGTMNGAFPSSTTGTISGTMSLQTALPVNVTLSFISSGTRTPIQTLPAGSTSTNFSFALPTDAIGLTEGEMLAYFELVRQEVAAA